MAKAKFVGGQEVRVFDARPSQAEPRLDVEQDALGYAVGGGLAVYVMDRDGDPYAIAIGPGRRVSALIADVAESGSAGLVAAAHLATIAVAEFGSTAATWILDAIREGD